MYVQYVGVDSSVGSRIYSFQVIDPPQEARAFTVKVRSEEFSADRLKFQDGPAISSARLQRELKKETQEARAKGNLRIDEQDVKEYRALHYPSKEPSNPSDKAPGSLVESSLPGKHFQDRGYSPLGSTRLPKSEDISTLLLHEIGEPLDALRLALESQSVKVHCVRGCQEALPLLTGPNPPQLIFTQPGLPDGTWQDVVQLALKATKPVNVIVVGHVANVRLYLQTINGGAFDFIVPPMTGYELTHILRCAIENVLCRREAQTRPA